MSQADPVLLKIYAGEQAEHVARMRSLLVMLRGTEPGASGPVLDELSRRAHTLKGAARAVGIEEIERIVHRMESVIAYLREHTSVPDAAARALDGALDAVEDMLASILGERKQPDWRSALRSLEAVTGESSEPEPPPEPAAAREEIRSHAELVRVDAATLDALIRVSSQMVTITSANPASVRETEELDGEISETIRQYQRLRRACTPYLRTTQSDPRSAPLAECLEYIDGRLAVIAASSRRVATARQRGEWRLRRQVEELHEYAAQARMTPAGAVLAMFGPMVRGLAEQEGKQAAFHNEGLHVQADRMVLQSLKDAVMHLLRNAVSHGIEPPRERIAAGKPEAGLIVLRVHSRGSRLSISVEDDGAGLDFSALAHEAERRGMREPANEELTRLVFSPGFSTAPSVSAVSGRGMGLSVVNETVARLRGEVSLAPRDGGGTVVHISVPLSIATEHVLLVEEGEHTFALPGSLIEAVFQKTLKDITLVDGRECILIASDPVPLVRLSELLGLEGGAPEPPERGGSVQVVVLKSGGNRAAVTVGRVVDEREVIVRETGLPARSAGMSAGAIPLEDQAVAVMLNAGDLVQRFAGSGGAKHRFTASQEESRKHRILVVDDSITTRSLERSILEAHGYHVEVAVDGVEALEKVRAAGVDLVISDVAMPRMDGFELLEQLKSGKETANIPVILVTSLERPEEQERGLSLGADAYIVKRKFDQRDLLATVRQIL